MQLKSCYYFYYKFNLTVYKHTIQDQLLRYQMEKNVSPVDLLREKTCKVRFCHIIFVLYYAYCY